MCCVDSCSEEGSQLKLTEAAQAPLVKQNLDTNVITSFAFLFSCQICRLLLHVSLDKSHFSILGYYYYFFSPPAQSQQAEDIVV